MFLEINSEVVNLSMVKNFFFYEDGENSKIIFQYKRWNDVNIKATKSDFYDVMERLEKADLALI